MKNHPPPTLRRPSGQLFPRLCLHRFFFFFNSFFVLHGGGSRPRRLVGLPRRATARPADSVDPLHFAQDPAFVHGEYRLVVPDLLEDRATGKLVAGFFEVIP